MENVKILLNTNTTKPTKLTFHSIKDDRVCAQLFCFDAGSGYCVSYRPAAEGSRCGDGYVRPCSTTFSSTFSREV